MAEPFEDESASDHQSDAAAQFMRRELSQTISRRLDVCKSATPRFGGKAEVCDVVYEKSLLEEEEGDALASITERQARTSQEKRKLVIILVGLPGRGKTYLCNKLLCYLNWCGAPAWALISALACRGF